MMNLFAEATGGDQIAMWTAVSAIGTAVIGALLTAFNSWLSYRMKIMLKDNTDLTTQTKELVNGRMTVLLDTAHKSGYDRGVKDASEKQKPKKDH